VIFTSTAIEGAYVIETERHSDERGWFGRTFCRDEFVRHGLDWTVEQCSLSFNEAKGTLRGMHFQSGPGAEPKLVRCVHGQIFDVVLDLRPASTTFRRWVARELNGDQADGLYVPSGCAHGFLTLEPDTEVLYMIGAPYVPALARGVRWNDPAFSIDWPFTPSIMSARDAGYPDFTLTSGAA